MAGIEYTNPFASVGETLRNVLLQREQKRRQDMLDQVTLDRERRLAEATDAQTANTKANTESIIQQRQVNEEAARAKMAADAEKAFVGAHRIGDKVTADDATKYAGYVQPVQRAKPTVGPAPGYDDQAMPSEMEATGEFEFTGTPQDRARRDLLNTIDDPTLKQRLQLLFESGANIGGEDIVSLLQPKPAKRETQEVGGYLFEKQDDGSWKKVAEGRAPQAPRDPVPVVVQTAQGPQIVDRGNGTARPITDSSGMTVGMMPTADMRNREAAQGRVRPVLDSISELSERINTNQGIYAKAVGMAEKQAAKLNLDDDVAEYQALVQAFTPLWARALGHTGVLTEQDVVSAREALPKPGDSKSLRDRKLARIEKLMADQPHYNIGAGETPGGGRNDDGWTVVNGVRIRKKTKP